MATKFVCGADITFKDGKKFAVDPMGVFDTVEAAVEENAKLHPSFGYNVYEVEETLTSNLMRSFGFRQGTKCSGRRVLSLACEAYNHPAWQTRV